MGRITLSAGEVQALYDKLESIEKIVKHNVPVTDNPVLSTEQVMKFLNCSRRSLQSYRDNGLIEYSVVQGKFLYQLKSIYKMLDNHLQKMEE